jgi:hypothetical protein
MPTRRSWGSGALKQIFSALPGARYQQIKRRFCPRSIVCIVSSLGRARHDVEFIGYSCQFIIASAILPAWLEKEKLFNGPN